MRQAPARLNVRQAAWLLNVQEHDIPVLVAAKLLKPLGNPGQNCTKYFATVQIRELALDAAWLARATNALHSHWRQKNARRKSGGIITTAE